jgi:hypothetical protein
MISNISIVGTLKPRKISAPGPGWAWHLKNRIRPSFWLGWVAVRLAHGLTALTLSLIHI